MPLRGVPGGYTMAHLPIRMLKKTLFYLPFAACFLVFLVIFTCLVQVITIKNREQTRLRHLQDSYYKPNRTIVNPHDFRVLIQPRVSCLNAQEKGVHLVVVILSAVGRKEYREMVRNTWGSYIRNTGTRWPNVNLPDWTRPEFQNFKVYFLFGTKPNSTSNNDLRLENERYGDIIQEDFVDTYANLTIKSIMGLKWVMTNCKGAKYVMKVDDDVFVNLPNLIKFLSALPEDGIGGRISRHATVWREGKWKISIDDFPFKWFPPYAIGCNYVMGLPMAEKLYNTSLHVRPIHLEDVYVTGILGKINKVRHVESRGFSFSGLRPPNACYVLKRFVITGTNWKEVELIQALWLELWDADAGAKDLSTCRFGRLAYYP